MLPNALHISGHFQKGLLPPYNNFQIQAMMPRHTSSFRLVILDSESKQRCGSSLLPSPCRSEDDEAVYTTVYDNVFFPPTKTTTNAQVRNFPM